MQEINESLQNQVKGLKRYKEEEQQIKMQEKANFEKLRLKMIEEEELGEKF